MPPTKKKVSILHCREVEEALLFLVGIVEVGDKGLSNVTPSTFHLMRYLSCCKDIRIFHQKCLLPFLGINIKFCAHREQLSRRAIPTLNAIEYRLCRLAAVIATSASPCANQSFPRGVYSAVHVSFLYRLCRYNDSSCPDRIGALRLNMPL